MNNKKSIFSFLLLTLIFLNGCSKDDFTGSDNIITITRDLPEFTKIDVQTSLEVNVIQSNTQIVEIMVNDNLQSRITTNVSNNTLFISLKDGSYENDTFVVNIQLPNLERLQLNDDTRGSVNFTSNQFEFEVNGSSQLSLDGSSEILNTEINDDGKISAFSFATAVLNTRSRDASELEITCSNELNGTVYEASKVSYRGTPTINAQTSEDGQIINAN